MIEELQDTEELLKQVEEFSRKKFIANIPKEYKLDKTIRAFFEHQELIDFALIPKFKTYFNGRNFDLSRLRYQPWQVFVDGTSYCGLVDKFTEQRHGYGLYLDEMGNYCYGLFRNGMFKTGTILTSRGLRIITTSTEFLDEEHSRVSGDRDISMKIFTGITTFKQYEGQMRYLQPHGYGVMGGFLHSITDYGNVKFEWDPEYSKVKNFHSIFKNGKKEGYCSLEYESGHTLKVIFKEGKFQELLGIRQEYLVNLEDVRYKKPNESIDYKIIKQEFNYGSITDSYGIALYKLKVDRKVKEKAYPKKLSGKSELGVVAQPQDNIRTSAIIDPIHDRVKIVQSSVHQTNIHLIIRFTNDWCYVDMLEGTLKDKFGNSTPLIYSGIKSLEDVLDLPAGQTAIPRAFKQRIKELMPRRNPDQISTLDVCHFKINQKTRVMFRYRMKSKIYFLIDDLNYLIHIKRKPASGDNQMFEGLVITKKDSTKFNGVIHFINGSDMTLKQGTYVNESLGMDVKTKVNKRASGGGLTFQKLNATFSGGYRAELKLSQILAENKQKATKKKRKKRSKIQKKELCLNGTIFDSQGKVIYKGRIDQNELKPSTRVAIMTYNSLTELKLLIIEELFSMGSEDFFRGEVQKLSPSSIHCKGVFTRRDEIIMTEGEFSLRDQGLKEIYQLKSPKNYCEGSVKELIIEQEHLAGKFWDNRKTSPTEMFIYRNAMLDSLFEIEFKDRIIVRKANHCSQTSFKIDSFQILNEGLQMIKKYLGVNVDCDGFELIQKSSIEPSEKEKEDQKKKDELVSDVNHSEMMIQDNEVAEKDSERRGVMTRSRRRSNQNKFIGTLHRGKSSKKNPSHNKRSSNSIGSWKKFNFIKENKDQKKIRGKQLVRVNFVGPIIGKFAAQIFLINEDHEKKDYPFYESPSIIVMQNGSFFVSKRGIREVINGKGVLKYPVQRFMQKLESDNFEVGVLSMKFGKITYSTGAVYEGIITFGFRHGPGKMTWRNGEVYEGEWSEGLRFGTGSMKFKNGDFYEGGWIMNCMNGEGVMHLASGERLEGRFSNNKFVEGFIFDGEGTEVKFNCSDYV